MPNKTSGRQWPLGSRAFQIKHSFMILPLDVVRPRRRNREGNCNNTNEVTMLGQQAEFYQI
jgi:hypothetical protein